MGKENYFKIEAKEVGQYEGIKLFSNNHLPKECVAMMNYGGFIEIHPDALEILKEKPEYLERIYQHEINAGPGHGSHKCEDTDILLYLKERGYDFGTLAV